MALSVFLMLFLNIIWHIILGYWRCFSSANYNIPAYLTLYPWIWVFVFTRYWYNKKESYKIMNQSIIYLYEQYLNKTHNLPKETGFRKRNTVLDWIIWWRAVWVRQRLGCLYVCCLIYLRNGKEFRPFKYTNEWVILASIGLTINLYRTAWSSLVRQENYSSDCMIESMTTRPCSYT